MFIARITERRYSFLERHTVLLDVRVRLYWIPLEVVTHRLILQFHWEWLHRHNGLAMSRKRREPSTFRTPKPRRADCRLHRRVMPFVYAFLA